jgi:hypothetical protein
LGSLYTDHVFTGKARWFGAGQSVHRERTDAMKPPLSPKPDYLKHFAKDDARTKIAALALLMAPAILYGMVALLSVIFGISKLWHLL